MTNTDRNMEYSRGFTAGIEAAATVALEYRAVTITKAIHALLPPAPVVPVDGTKDETAVEALEHDVSLSKTFELGIKTGRREVEHEITALRAQLAAIRAALEPLANVPLWRDTYQDGPDIVCGSSAWFTPEQVRIARAALGRER